MFSEGILSNFWSQFKAFLPAISVAILIFVIGWFLSSKINHIIARAMRRAKVDESIISFAGSILLILFRSIVILATLSKLGVEVTALIAALGAAFVTVGIALKDSLSNIASGVIIIINKPFRVGDFLEFGTNSGKVMKIELMFTTILTPDNRELIVPNSNLTSSDIINCSRQKIRRIDLTYSAKNINEVNKIKNNFINIINNNQKVLKSPKSNIIIKEIDGENVKISASVWCSAIDFDALHNEIQENMLI